MGMEAVYELQASMQAPKLSIKRTQSSDVQLRRRLWEGSAGIDALGSENLIYGLQRFYPWKINRDPENDYLIVEKNLPTPIWQGPC